ncbi:ABC transporter permease [Azohydromonas caseinilytica]|uniref:ABC transporter permease n=1 Tax=Azohydromonas caseinilytica TaxID=2728836 RepID=A0A848FF25_9BURK|nr:ABC transporter permease [Azohydromonas caseinilytica]NML18018.1 ABC transporter permease [Azohydromonas caseinilytica]
MAALDDTTLPAPRRAWPLGRLSRPGLLGLGGVMLLLAVGTLAPLLFDLDPYGLSQRLRWPPTPGAGGPWLGTDDLGRDQLARLVYGARTSLGIGLAVVASSLGVGTLLGLLAGVYGGWVDRLVARAMDLAMSLPSILLAIVVVAVLGPGLLNAVLAVSLVAVPRFVRVVRSVAVLEMRKPYVQAARSCGVSRWRLLYSEVLPNCRAPVIVQAALGFSDAILEIAALGFLGLGAPAPVAEWGAMLADARPFIETEPHLMLLPGLCILAAVLSFNLLGDALRDALDPRTGSR